MSLGLAVFNLPISVARCVTDFLFNPLQGADTVRLATWIPPQIDASLPDAGRTLAKLLGSAEPVLDPAHPLHQIALLPTASLTLLARRVAVDTLGWALRQVVRREDLDRLDALVTPQDWNHVYQAATAQPAPQRRLGDVQVLIEDLQRVGWYLLEQVSDSVPRPVGLRLLLKCPSVERPRLVSAELGDAWVADRIADTYRSWVHAEHPDWEASLRALPSAEKR